MLTRYSRSLRLAAGVAVAAMCVSLLSSCGFSSSKTIYARFSTAAGLFVGNDVGVLGVPIGKVTAVKPEGTDVLVTMQINGDQKIPAGAAAVVVSRSVATDRYVEITPVYTSGPQMVSGSTIGLDRTQTPVEFDQVLTTIGNFANQISGSGADKDAIARFLNATSTSLSGRGDLINQAIKSLGAAVNGISAQRDNATSTLVALDGLTSALASNQQTIKDFVQQVSQATSLLAAERDNFKTAITSATQMVNQVAQFAQDNRAQITQAVNQTNGVMTTLVAEFPQIAEMMKELPLATQNLQKSINSQGELVVRLDLTALIPILGNVLGPLCSTLQPLGVCQLIGTNSLTNPTNITNALLGLLGVKP